MFKPKDWLDRLFEIGIVLKGLNGLAELLGGILLQLWAYPCMITVLLIFIGYQLYRIVLQPSLGLALLTVFDALIVALTWREYRRQRRTPPKSAFIADNAPPQIMER
jgi:uncharacterized membrane protein